MFIHNKTNNVNLYVSILHTEHSTHRFTIYTRYTLTGVFPVSKQPIQNTFRSVQNYFHFLRIERWKNLLVHSSPLLTQASIWPWETFDWIGTNIWNVLSPQKWPQTWRWDKPCFLPLVHFGPLFIGHQPASPAFLAPTGPDPELPSSDSPSHSLF